jgi:hypothetical protein
MLTQPRRLRRSPVAAWLACTWLVAPLCAWAGNAALQVSPDGQHLIDPQHGVWWSRCPEGMAWHGQHCEGSALLMSQHDAAKHATARNSQGEGWRLPRAAELHRLFSQDRGDDRPDPHLAALRRVDPDWYWSASASVDSRSVNTYSYGNVMRGVTSDNTSSLSFLHGWAVQAGRGDTRSDVTKKTRLPVLLLRTAPAP